MKVTRKAVSTGVAVLCATLLVGGLSYLAMGTPSVKKTSEQKNNNVNYALVNEDIGSTFNGKNYMLGKDFVSLINQDTKNSWQTAPLSVAESGFQTGAYDVVIVLPQNFSERLLSLQSFTPEQAQISYKVRTGKNALANAAIEQKVGAILTNFNQRIVQMYFSSVLGNLFEAQRNVGDIVTGQKGTHASLLNDVQTPFKELPSTFTSVVTTSQSLANDNKNWQEQQEHFTKQTQETLDKSAESLMSNLGSLKEYTDLQKRISETNLGNAQAALTSQSADDTKTYRRLYEAFDQTTMGQMHRFDRGPAPKSGTEPTVMDGVNQAADTFADQQQQQITRLQKNIQNLREQANDLVQLRGKVAQDYFSDRTASPDSVTDEQIKTAILAKIAQLPANRSKLPAVYTDALNQTVKATAPKDLLPMAEKLSDQKLLTKEQLATYQQEAMIVERYAADQQLSFSKQTFSYIEAQNDQYPSSKDFLAQTLSFDFVIDPTKTYTITMEPAANKNVQIKNIRQLCDALRAKINPLLTGKNLEFWAVKDDQNPNQIKATFLKVQQKPKTKPTDSTTASTSDSSTASSSSEEKPPVPTEKEHLQVEIPVDLTWTFSAEEKKQAYNTAEYTWKMGDQPLFSGSLSAYVNIGSSDAQLKQDLSPLLGQFQRLDQAAQSVVTLYGDPSKQTRSVASFYDYLRAHPNGKIQELASDTSVYHRYGNMNDTEKRTLISDSLVKTFRKEGSASYQKIDRQYKALMKTIGSAEEGSSLEGTLHQLPSPDLLHEQAQKLTDWAGQANKAIADTYAQWKDNPKHALTAKEATVKPEPAEDTIYFNQATGNQTYQSFEQLIKGSKEQALSTKDAAAKIQSLENQFKDLRAQTTTVKEETTKVLGDVNKLTTEADKQMTSNADYASNFGTVMANARTGGTNNPQVFDFLSSPIAGRGTFGRSARPSLVPYFMTVIGFLLTIALGNSIRLLERRRSQREEDRLLVATTSWLNTPTVLSTLGFAVLAGLAFGLMTQGSSPAKFGWISYVFLVTASGILIASYLFRQVPKLAFYLLGGVLGVYLLLTPVLGVSVVPGSGVEWLLRLSPLQNTENGYTALVTGGSVGGFSYVLLLFLFGVGLLINFTVKQADGKEPTE